MALSLDSAYMARPSGMLTPVVMSTGGSAPAAAENSRLPETIAPVRNAHLESFCTIIDPPFFLDQTYSHLRRSTRSHPSTCQIRYRESHARVSASIASRARPFVDSVKRRAGAIAFAV